MSFKPYTEKIKKNKIGTFSIVRNTDSYNWLIIYDENNIRNLESFQLRYFAS